MKREKMIVMLLALLLLLSACGSPDSSSTEPSAIPARMVSRLEVSIHPADDSLARNYEDMEKMTPILRFLRDMDTTQKPEEEPLLTDGQTYYTITAIYANGDSRTYYLLSHKFMRVDQGEWCEIDNLDAMELIQYIRNTPDSEEAPTEESLPEETTEATQAPSEESTAAPETENTDETTASE